MITASNTSTIVQKLIRKSFRKAHATQKPIDLPSGSLSQHAVENPTLWDIYQLEHTMLLTISYKVIYNRFIHLF